MFLCFIYLFSARPANRRTCCCYRRTWWTHGALKQNPWAPCRPDTLTLPADIQKLCEGKLHSLSCCLTSTSTTMLLLYGVKYDIIQVINSSFFLTHASTSLERVTNVDVRRRWFSDKNVELRRLIHVTLHEKKNKINKKVFHNSMYVQPNSAKSANYWFHVTYCHLN